MAPRSPTTPRSITGSRTFVSYRPFGVGLRCAMFYFEMGPDVYGWWIGPQHSQHYSAYYKLENFFTAGSTLFYASGGMDLYGGWRFLYSARTAALDEPVAVEQEPAHELERLQSMFVAEWLFFDDDPDTAHERAAYEKLKMPLRRVNIHSHALTRLTGQDSEMQYQSPDFDIDVLDYLQRHWPLDYHKTWKSRRVQSAGS